MWAVLGLGSALWACDTPVFQYTMQNWHRDSYRVYCLYEGKLDAATQAANRALADASSKSGHANLTLTRVDVADARAVLPPSVRRVRDGHRSQPLPAYAVLSPRGAEVHVGRLGPGDVDALVNSPKRKELAKLLSARKRGAVILLSGSDTDENRRATDAVRGVARAAAGREEDYGVVEVDRTDPAEHWFVRQLLTVEPDLDEIRSAMAFPVFGRGHFLPPYVGPGINERNLRDLQDFLNGPCSCEIKESSQGMDLLLDWDFDEATAHWPDATATSTSPGFSIFDIAPPDTSALPSPPTGAEPQAAEAAPESAASDEPPADGAEPVDSAPVQDPVDAAGSSGAGFEPPPVVPPSWPEASSGPDGGGDAWERAEVIALDQGLVLTDSGPQQRHLGPNLAAMRGAGQPVLPADLEPGPSGFARIAAAAMAALAILVAITGSAMVRRARRLAAAGAEERGSAA